MTALHISPEEIGPLRTPDQLRGHYDAVRRRVFGQMVTTTERVIEKVDVPFHTTEYNRQKDKHTPIVKALPARLFHLVLEETGILFKTNTGVLISYERSPDIVYARCVACFVGRKKFNLKVVDMAKILRRDHSSVTVSVRRIAGIYTDPVLREQVQTITDFVTARKEGL